MSHPLASSSVSQSFQNLLYTVVCSIPKILVFLTVLVIGWISKVLAWIVDMILRRVKFDHFVERGFAGRPLARSKIVAMTLITKIVYYSILLVTLQMAFGVFGPNPISAMLGGVVAWLPGAIVAIVIFLIAPAITKVVKALIKVVIGGLSHGLFLSSVASIIIVTLDVIAAVNRVGIGSAITKPILYTVLLTGVAIVAIDIGGGLIKPMQEGWERMVTAAERETNTQITAYQEGRTDATRAPRQARPDRPAYQPTRSGPGHSQGTEPGDRRDPGITHR